MDNEQLATRMRSAQGIPGNPEIQAKMAANVPTMEQPAVPPGVEPATPAEQGLEPQPAVDFFGQLAADMDAETQSSPAPVVPIPQHPAAPSAPVEELPYEPPVHQRQPGEPPESLEPQPVVETPPLEAAIEQPLKEEEIRLTAEQWAQQQRALTPPQETPPPAQQPVDPAKLEAQAIDQLEKTEYVLSDDDKNALIAEPDQVIPRLAARMHVRMSVQLAQQITQILPGMIAQAVQQQGKVQSLEQSFFSQYPELNKPEYRATVAESLTMIRQVNPQADRDTVMRDGAALAAVRLRTRLGEQQPQAQQPALPQNMPLGAPHAQPTPQPQAPFTPAQAGGVTPPVVPTDPNQDNIFATLAGDDDW